MAEDNRFQPTPLNRPTLVVDTPVFEPETFFAYVDTIDGRKLAGNVRIIMSAVQREDRRSGRMTFDPMGQKVIQFVGGMFIAKDQETVDFLTNYNKLKPLAKFLVSSDIIMADGSVRPEAQVIVKTKIVIPLTVARTMEPTALRELLKEQFQYVPTGDSAAEIVEEGQREGFFI